MTLPYDVLLVSALTIVSPMVANGQRSTAQSVTAQAAEEIYVARAVREARAKPTAFCDRARIGFDRAVFEDRFGLRSIEVRPSDGRVIRTDVQTIGEMRVCFGETADPATLNFYAEGKLATLAFVGRGECLTVNRDFPEPGITVMRCFLALDDLPAGYVGGQFTTNTILSRIAVGANSDPQGYTQPSIVTVRLWKGK